MQSKQLPDECGFPSPKRKTFTLLKKVPQCNKLHPETARFNSYGLHCCKP